MSIEHKKPSAASNVESASPVGNANAEAIPHHPITDCFPILAEKELAELAEDIATNGQREPGVVWNGMLLDGLNRQLACKLKNIPFKWVTRDFADENEAIEFVISANLRRRHLSESQRAMIGAKLVEFLATKKLKALSTDGEDTPNASAKVNLKSRDKAAETLNVSARSIQDAIKVRAEGTPELVNAVNAGQVSVSAAAQVASLGKDEQVKMVNTPGGVKAEAKKLRNDKKSAVKNADRKTPANNLPSNPGAAPTDALKNAESPHLPDTPEQPKASSSEQTLAKNRLRFTPDDAEIERASLIFCDASAANTDCKALAARLLDGKHPGVAAETWKCVEEFASKMREAYESLNERLNEKVNTGESHEYDENGGIIE